MTSNSNSEKKIVVQPNGPYLVHGDVPLVRKSQVVSEHGEPLTWRKDHTLESKAVYALCRCGQSSNKPFCDGTHAKIGFDGAETAETEPTTERQVVFKGKGIVVKRDYSLCMESGFCGNRFANIEKMVPEAEDSVVRGQIMAMAERCPSGSYTYSLAEDGPDIEPDLPQQVAVAVEITSDGPIAGPLWVTGSIPVERADGKPLETRNRVTLCRCGQSNSKPLCDGTHRAMHITED